MNADQIDQLRAVNRAINALPFEALPAADEPDDWWTDEPVPGRSFVCRDFVLMKAEALERLGWPKSALTVVLCWTELLHETNARGYHAVLAVQSADEAEATILDSRFDDPYPMATPPADYVWDRRQVVGTVEFEPVA